MSIEGYENGAVMVPFSADGRRVLPLEWASAVLTMMAEREPERLGAYIGEAATGVAPKAGRRQ